MAVTMETKSITQVHNFPTSPGDLVVGCGFDPWPRRTNSCIKIVQAAPLLTLDIKR